MVSLRLNQTERTATNKNVMATPSDADVTALLIAWGKGDETALEQLTPLVYGELHRLAKVYMHGERRAQTLQTTALINEAYLRLIDWKNVQWQNRAHFIGIAANVMRRVLVDFARSRNYAKRGGGAQPEDLTEALQQAAEKSAELVALDDALRSLEAFDARKCRVVELRFFGGLSNEEIATVLQISPRTVLREWTLARAWLHRELARQ
jgi:RNA polymerase sigma-70 factor, ECF subfamily